MGSYVSVDATSLVIVNAKLQQSFGRIKVKMSKLSIRYQQIIKLGVFLKNETFAKYCRCYTALVSLGM